MTGLLDPLIVKGVTLRNRIVMPPMQSGRASFEGEVTSKLVNFYVRRSAALGLPIVEHAYVSALGKIGPKQLGIYSDKLTAGLEKLACGIHLAGAPAVVQLSHAGAVANKKIIGVMPVGPSSRDKVRMLEKNELYELADEFAWATERAVEADFDGVELHGAHGYLLNQFFTPLINKRTDEFGGSLENRMRFPLLVVEKVQRHLKGGLLLYRLGADDLAPMGTQLKEAIVFAQKLQQAGVDIMDVSGGMCGSEPKQLQHIKGYFIPQASAIKAAVEVPVIGVGKIKEAQFADTLIREGKIDLAAIGRALWHDNLWPQKAHQTLQQHQNPTN
ncbi:MAG: NADH:flavin oxidoreductase [Nitrososphaerota archaeon]|nr:NADH:flavin oxidoreductase [Nitrososphaerota archaeon]